MDPSNNGSSLLSAFNILALTSSVNGTLLDLVDTVQRQGRFSTIFVLKHGDEGVGDDILSALDIPLIQLTDSKSCQLKRRFNAGILAIVYLSERTYLDVIGALARNLHRMAQTKIVFICSGMEHLVEELFQAAWSKKMLNAIAFMEDAYYSYNPFPEMQITLHSVHDDREVFPNRMLNLHRYPFRIVIDGIEPRTFVYTNRRGQKSLGGYTVRVVAAFAEKINATLTAPIDNNNKVFHHTDYDALLESNAIDIYAGLAYQIPTTRGQSDVAEVIGWCLMLPVEANVPQYLYYPMILGSLPILLMFGMVFVFSVVTNFLLWAEGRLRLSVARLFLHEDCIRAILGQSFVGQQDFSMKLRMIYFLSCLSGLFFNTWYLATLNTLVTSPPSEPKLTSLDEIQRSPLRVMFYRGEYEDIRKTTEEFEKYRNIFVFMDDNTLYHAIRNSMDRNYAFPVPTNKWRMFEEQQSLYKAPIFRFTDISIARFSLMVFLLNENSIFTQDLNQLIVRTHQSGLYAHWVTSSFLDLVEGGRIKLQTLNEHHGPSPLKLHDMKWIWGLFGVLVAVDCAALLAELVHFYFICE